MAGSRDLPPDGPSGPAVAGGQPPAEPAQRDPSFVAYIDESGDEGFRWRHPSGGGSSTWLILSAIVVRRRNDHLLPKLQRALLDELRPTSKSRVFHFRHLSHYHRIHLLRSLHRLPIRTISVIVNKTLLGDPTDFRDGRLYARASLLLVERVSWLCRDYRDVDGDGTVRLRFEHRRSTSYEQLRNELARMRHQAKEGGGSIDWSVIHPEQVAAFPKESYFGLQAADAVAGAFFHGLEANRQGLVEPRYCRELSALTYSRGGRRLSFGATLWPPSTEEWVYRQPHLSWFATCYPR